ncbi:DUF3310 domain-containing protein [Cloacibacillus sp. An23]|uniref:DUF3310 domain-containing protein n=1 Tax=Cloacibacillus sp. An23 TaxID=1965591 RepID=UPI000B36CF87|nr:DUF3310 domain-containing protein [Cloacibacillus sp. An23]OUO94782.1 hypothetical protein B5F39_02625 [Cloacibacillus sp. An23]
MNETTSTTHGGTAADATHYQTLAQQPIEIMQRLMTKEQFLGFCHGNVVKYALRCGHKDDPAKEMEKVRQYADWYVSAARGETIDPMKKAQVETIGPGCYLYAAPKAHGTEKSAEAPSPDPEQKSWIDCVKEFNKAYDVPTLPGPALRYVEYLDTLATQAELINEEINELNVAFDDWMGGGDAKVAILDAICDSIYVLIGLALKMGFNLDAAFREVHRSNMSKLGEDGKPIKRDDGKVLKGPNFTPPNLEPYI